MVQLNWSRFNSSSILLHKDTNTMTHISSLVCRHFSRLAEREAEHFEVECRADNEKLHFWAFKGPVLLHHRLINEF